MLNHVINKEVFDITCKNEEAASTTRLAIQHYAIVRINEIIDEILAENYMGSEYLYADKIEIDLGEIDLAEFGDQEMFEKFRELFKAKIKFAGEDQRQESGGPISHHKRLDKEFEMTKAFLLNGDLPWWSDKHEKFDLNAVFKRLLKHQHGKLQGLLKECQDDPSALWRLFDHVNPATRSAIETSYPEVFKNAINHSFIGEAIEFTSEASTSIAFFEKFKQFSSRRTTPSAQDSRNILLGKLLRLDRKFRNRKTAGSATHQANPFLQKVLRQTGIASYPKLKAKLKDELNSLSIFQVEFILFQLSLDGFSSLNVEGFWEDQVETAFDITAKENANHIFLQDFRSQEKDLSIPFAYDEIDSEESAQRVDGLKQIIPAEGEDAEVIHAGGNMLPDQRFEKAKQFGTFLSMAEELAYLALKQPISKKHTPDERLAKESKFNHNEWSKISSEEVFPVDRDNIFSPHQDKTLSQEQGNIFPGNPDFSAAVVNIQDPAVLNSDSPSKPREADNSGSRSSSQNSVDNGNLVDAVKSDSRLTFKNESVSPNENPEQPGIASNKTFPAQESPEQEFALSEFEPGDAKKQKEENLRARKIALVLKTLRTNDIILSRYMEQLDLQTLSRLTARLKNHQTEHLQQRRKIADLLKLSDTLIFKVFKLFLSLYRENQIVKSASIPTRTPGTRSARSAALSWFEKEIQFSQEAVEALTSNLKAKELFLLKNILAKQSIEEPGEKKIFGKIVSTAAKQDSLFVYFLSELNASEIDRFYSLYRSKEARQELQAKREDARFPNTGPEKIYIENAGLCLLAIYFQGFFKRMGFTEKTGFKDKVSALKAVYLLEYLATGKKKSPEYLLQLNKLLCGFLIDENTSSSIRLNKKEYIEADNLLESAIGHWKSLKNTSLDGFRQSFLQRKGILEEDELKWTLRVEKKGYDLLLNTIPWGYSLIKLPWMTKHLQVEW